jgi:capsular exopolysaccharide synthesis family protein
VDLRDYLRIFRRGWALLLACVVLGVGAGVALTLVTTKSYQASVQLFVAADTSTSSDTQGLAQSNNFVQARVQSYTSIATSPEVAQQVVNELHLKTTASDLADKITADAPANKVLVNIHVVDHNAQTAATLANAVAKVFATVVEQTEQTDADGKSVVKLTVIHPARIPSSPVKPDPVLYIGLGLALGILLGVGVVVVRDMLDNTVKGPADFEELGLSVLGTVPLDGRTKKTPIAFRGDPHGTRAEAYRLLRTNLQFVGVDDAPHVIAVTSAVLGEGKSTTALNLAAALAEAGHRVCLVEADLRRPTMAKSLGLVPDIGFTTVLIGKVPLASALQNAGRNLAVLTSGSVPPNPSELLNSAHARELIAEVAAQADYTIIDTAPLLPVADGAEVASLAEATILVHRAGKTSREQVSRAVTSLGKVGVRPVGVIVNMVTRKLGRYDYEDNYYYTYRPDPKRRHRAERTSDAKAGAAHADDSPADLAAIDAAFGANPAETDSVLAVTAEADHTVPAVDEERTESAATTAADDSAEDSDEDSDEDASSDDDVADVGKRVRLGRAAGRSRR